MRWTVLAILLVAMILVPFFLFEDQFNALAHRLIENRESHGYVAAAVVALLTSDVFLPIPSSVVSAASGLLLGFVPGAAAVWVGMTAACLLGYAFGSKASAAARRYVGEKSLNRAAHLARSYGDYAIIMCRPVPVLAEASVILAGVVHTPLKRFVVLTMLANLGVSLGYSAIGAFSMHVDSFVLAFFGSIALPGIGILVSKLWFKREVSSPDVSE